MLCDPRALLAIVYYGGDDDKISAQRRPLSLSSHHVSFCNPDEAFDAILEPLTGSGGTDLDYFPNSGLADTLRVRPGLLSPRALKPLVILLALEAKLVDEIRIRFQAVG
jgi:hypothetical protein